MKPRGENENDGLFLATTTRKAENASAGGYSCTLATPSPKKNKREILPPSPASTRTQLTDLDYTPSSSCSSLHVQQLEESQTRRNIMNNFEVSLPVYHQPKPRNRLQTSSPKTTKDEVPSHARLTEESLNRLDRMNHHQDDHPHQPRNRIVLLRDASNCDNNEKEEEKEKQQSDNPHVSSSIGTQEKACPPPTLDTKQAVRDSTKHADQAEQKVREMKESIAWWKEQGLRFLNELDHRLVPSNNNNTTAASGLESLTEPYAVYSSKSSPNLMQFLSQEELPDDTDGLDESHTEHQSPLSPPVVLTRGCSQRSLGALRSHFMERWKQQLLVNPDEEQIISATEQGEQQVRGQNKSVLFVVRGAKGKQPSFETILSPHSQGPSWSAPNKTDVLEAAAAAQKEHDRGITPSPTGGETKKKPRVSFMHDTRLPELLVQTSSKRKLFDKTDPRKRVDLTDELTVLRLELGLKSDNDDTSNKHKNGNARSHSIAKSALIASNLYEIREEIPEDQGTSGDSTQEPETTKQDPAENQAHVESSVRVLDSAQRRVPAPLVGTVTPEGTICSPVLDEPIRGFWNNTSSKFMCVVVIVSLVGMVGAIVAAGVIGARGDTIIFIPGVAITLAPATTSSLDTPGSPVSIPSLVPSGTPSGGSSSPPASFRFIPSSDTVNTLAVATVLADAPTTVTLTDVATVMLPANTFESPATSIVVAASTPLDSSTDLFHESASIFNPIFSTASFYQIGITVDSVPTTKTVSVSFVLPGDFVAQIDDIASVKVAVTVQQDAATSAQPFVLFTLVDATLEASTNQLFANIPGASFSRISPGTTHGNYQAIAMLCETSPRSSRQRRLQQGKPKNRRLRKAGACQANDILCPIDGGCEVATPFHNATFHPEISTPAYYGTVFSAPAQRAVLAAAAGTVVLATRSESAANYGNVVVLRHVDGTSTLYANLANFIVAAGDLVPAGGRIGTVGNTGFAATPQLHFEYATTQARIDPTACMVLTSPTHQPTLAPSPFVSLHPSGLHSSLPSLNPSGFPSLRSSSPSHWPSDTPSNNIPSVVPSAESNLPSLFPSSHPSNALPSGSPLIPSNHPTLVLSLAPVTLDPTPFLNQGYVKTQILSVLPSARAALEDPSTPQFEAFLWVVDQSSLGPIPGKRKILQLYALVTLYHSTGGDSSVWTSSNGWLANTNECSWFGISCSATSSVVSLSLPSNRLDGTIPQEVGILTDLSALDLSSNGNIAGKIPSQIGLLTALQRLWLRYNVLTGTLPTNLGLLTSATSLNLFGNALTGTIPSELEAMTNLVGLFLGDNTISGMIPSELCRVMLLSVDCGDVCGCHCGPCSA